MDHEGSVAVGNFLTDPNMSHINPIESLTSYKCFEGQLLPTLKGYAKDGVEYSSYSLVKIYQTTR
jgi:hypothetical protein